MRRASALLIGILGATVLPSPSDAQEAGVVAGRVIDARTQEPVATAAVRVVGTVLVTFADDLGAFELRSVPAGTRSLLVERFGYAPRELEVVVSAGGRTEIEVELEPRPVAVGEVVTTVTKRRLSTLETPVSVSVLEEQQIRERIADTAADAVAYTPSVQFVGDQLNIRGSSGYSRGAGSRVLMLVDGVPANAGDSGSINWDVLPLTEIRQIEILKGAGSALYGTSALGGVINVITEPPPADPIFKLRLRAGFYDDPPFSEWIWSSQTRGYGAVDLSYGRRLGSVGFWARGGRTLDDGYVENTDLERTNVALQATVGEDAGRLGIFGSWAREEYGAPILWCMRGDCEDPNLLAFQPARVPVSARDDRTRSDKARLHLTYTRRWSDRVDTFVRGHYQRNDWDTSFGDGNIGAVSDVFGGELRFDWRVANWFQLSLGGEGSHTRVEAENFFGTPEGGVDSLSVHDISNLALYAQGEFGFTRWLMLTAGVRQDVGLLDGGSLTDPWVDQTSPRVGLVISPVSITRIRASVGRGFRAPTADELFTATQVGGFFVVPNENLRPEQSLAGEVGVQQLVTPWLSLDLAGFFYEFEDLIEADTVLSPRGIEVQFQNLDSASVRGVEGIVRLSLFRDRLQGFVAYTYLDHEDKTTGQPLAYRPNHLVTTSGTVYLGSLELGADYRYASAFDRVKVFTDPRTDRLVPLNVLDLRLAYRFGRQVLRFIADNVGNHSYTTIERNLEPIRRYSLALELVF